MQREFGQGIASGWLGHETFKDLVSAAVPDARLEMDPPAYVLPPGFSAEALAIRPATREIPRAGFLLREIDQSFPAVSSDHWRRIYEALSAASAKVQWTGTPGLLELNALTKRARDDQSQSRRRVTRSELDYVAKALLFSGRLAPSMSPEEIANVFTTTLGRVESAGIDANDAAELGPWLNPYVTTSMDASET